VVRGVLNNGLYIITHPEFKAGFNARNEAIMRACPDEPVNQKRKEVLPCSAHCYITLYSSVPNMATLPCAFG